MKLRLLTLLALLPLLLSAQEKEESSLKLKLKGFVKADYIFDSRMNVEGREGFFALYPQPKVLDPNGVDIYDKASANQYGMTTRLGLHVSGPEIFNAKTTALIESDYTGPSNAHNNVFRLRHAFVKLSWSRSSLLVGQYWHPMDVPEMLPSVASLNTGAPFHSFSRAPQIRFTYQTGPVSWLAVAASQRDFVTIGPEGASSIYLRNAILPDLSLQAHFARKNFFAGAGVNYKELHFRTFTNDGMLLEDQTSNLSFLAFAKYENSKWDFRLQGVYGENLTDHLMLGGAAIHQVDSINAEIEYTNIAAASAWATIYFKHKGWKIGGFGGYVQNMGANDEINGPIYGRGGDIDYVYRVSPQWSYKVKNLMITNEYEYTTAAYGTPDLMGDVQDSYEVSNLRITLSLTYFIEYK